MPDVLAHLQQVRGEAVAQRVARRPLGPAKTANRVSNRALHSAFMDMVPGPIAPCADSATARSTQTRTATHGCAPADG